MGVGGGGGIGKGLSIVVLIVWRNPPMLQYPMVRVGDMTMYKNDGKEIIWNKMYSGYL